MPAAAGRSGRRRARRGPRPRHRASRETPAGARSRPRACAARSTSRARGSTISSSPPSARASPRIRRRSGCSRPPAARDAYFAGFGWTGEGLGRAGAGHGLDRQRQPADSGARPVTLTAENGQRPALRDRPRGRRRLSVHGRPSGSPTRRRRRRRPALSRWSAAPARRRIRTAGRPMSARSACSTAPPITNGIMATSPRQGDQRFASTGGWIGFTDKYWLTALVPDQASTRRRRLPPRPGQRRLPGRVHRRRRRSSRPGTRRRLPLALLRRRQGDRAARPLYRRSSERRSSGRSTGAGSAGS